MESDESNPSWLNDGKPDGIKPGNINRELPTYHPASFTESGGRNKIHPLEISGRYTWLRRSIHWILIVFFLSIPWIEIGGAPLLQLGISDRKFFVFGRLFFAQDGPLVLVVPLTFAITAALVSSLFGRLWCGYACPQTVFIDSVFRKIEALIEGNSVSRKGLATAPWTLSKIVRKSVKWLLFIAIATWIAHAFVALFTGPKEIYSSAASRGTLLFTTILFAFDFGWFREQFCLIACPYGRFQTVIADPHTRTVGFDVNRAQDCIQCYKCVAVCPTGVDIRRGMNQLECIGCASCLDACDSVMEKLDRPKGLIKYRRQEEDRGILSSKFLTPRTLLYFAILSVVIGSFTYILANRKPIDVAFIKQKGSPYERVTMQGGIPGVTNTFQFESANRTLTDLKVKLTAKSKTTLRPVQILTSENPVPLLAAKTARRPIVLEFDQADLSEGRGIVLVDIEASDSKGVLTRYTEEVKIIGPFH